MNAFIDNKNGKLVIQDGEIRFKNFTGRAGQYNREGDRSFAAVISEEFVPMCLDAGWNVKSYVSKKTGDTIHYIHVKVSYNNSAPTIVQHAGADVINYDESMCWMLDNNILLNIGIVISPYHWNINGKTGTSAYLNALHFELPRDYFADAYGAADGDENPF